MNILLKFCTLQIPFNLNKINHRNWNVWDLFFIVCSWHRKSQHFEFLLWEFQMEKKLFSVYICEVILKQLKDGKNIWQGRLVWWDKFCWSLNFRLQLFSSHYEANWKPLYFTNFWGIKSRIYDSCEISNCRDKNRFYGFLDTKTIQLLSSKPQKYFHEQKKPKWMQWRGRSLI